MGKQAYSHPLKNTEQTMRTERERERAGAYDLQHPSTDNSEELFLPAILVLVPLPAAAEWKLYNARNPIKYKGTMHNKHTQRRKWKCTLLPAACTPWLSRPVHGRQPILEAPESKAMISHLLKSHDILIAQASCLSPQLKIWTHMQTYKEYCACNVRGVEFNLQKQSIFLLGHDCLPL